MASGQEELNFVVDPAGSGQRIDRYLADQLSGQSRSKAQRLIDAGLVLVNDAVVAPSHKLKAGDRIIVRSEVQASPRTTASDRRPSFALDVLFEDEHVIVVNKPAGVAVHAGAGEHGATLVDALLDHCGTLGRPAAPTPLTQERPGIIHRLDKGTTGALVCAKTDEAHRVLAKQFHDKATEREYAAILDGRLSGPKVEIESYLFRSHTDRKTFASIDILEYARRFGGEATQGYRRARSLFARDAEFFGRLTLAAVRLFTGRTHQIRVHAKALAVPVLGDPVYHHGGPLPPNLPQAVVRAAKALDRQMLHARILGFKHPKSGVAMRFEAPYPADFLEFLVLLARESEAPPRG